MDIIPTFTPHEGPVDTLLSPGKLVNVGAAVTSGGGAVSNAGLALHRLGVRTRLMGKVGDDLLGGMVLEIVKGHDPLLAEGMVVAEGEPSSYTIVINPPGVDRTFLHCPGANDTFGADDVDYDAVAKARLFHFGYPPVMRRMFVDGGSELADMLERVRGQGVATSLDMSLPDPDSEAGRADWRALLARVLPAVDVFLPSLEETLYMLDRERFESLERESGAEGTIAGADGSLLEELSGVLLEMGAAVVVLKLGEQGLYLRTTDDRERLVSVGGELPERPADWRSRELLAPCFRVEVVGPPALGIARLRGSWPGCCAACRRRGR